MFRPQVLRFAQRRPTLIEAITRAGLTANLRLCLDAADASSYASGQKWLDRSGNGYDFFLGADGSATATDPTFNGTPGGRSSAEYFSFDGGDYFRYDAANETWMQNWHKDNAALSVLAAIHVPATAGAQGIIGTNSGGTNIGCSFFVGGDEQLTFQAGNGSGTALIVQADTALSTGAWNLVGLSLNESTGAGGGFFWRNGAYVQVSGADTWNSTYSSPSAGSAAFTMEVAARGNAVGPLASAARMGSLAAFEGAALSKANFDAIFTLIRDQWGL